VRVFRSVLHPTDFSSASRPALARAIALARQNRAALRIVHVLPPLALVIGNDITFTPRGVYEAVDRRARQEARTALATLVRRARKAGVRATSLLLDGAAHEQICRAARRMRAQVIVIGTHGRSGLSRAFMGSVAERVIRFAPCPVLAVRGR